MRLQVKQATDLDVPDRAIRFTDSTRAVRKGVSRPICWALRTVRHNLKKREESLRAGMLPENCFESIEPNSALSATIRSTPATVLPASFLRKSGKVRAKHNTTCQLARDMDVAIEPGGGVALEQKAATHIARLVGINPSIRSQEGRSDVPPAMASALICWLLFLPPIATSNVTWSVDSK